MKIFIPYEKCIFCNSNKLIIQKNIKFTSNFYVKAITDDLNLKKKKLEKIRTYKCEKCHVLQNSPWFTRQISNKIYNNIYGQHNRSWDNLIKFVSKKEFPKHGKLFEMLIKNIKIKKYAEFGSPFMGLFLNFYSSENDFKKKINQKLFLNTLEYLKSRQVAGKNANSRKSSMLKAKKALKIIKRIRKKLKGRKLITKKYLFNDNSGLSWGQNDNFESVNSRSLASELLNVKLFEMETKKFKSYFDLFGIFHSLDHTFYPKKVLNFALQSSNLVIVYCHTNKELSKQHLFSFTNDFLKFLKKQKIYTIDLTNKIKKNFHSPEMYFLCSKKKREINKLNLIYNLSNNI